MLADQASIARKNSMSSRTVTARSAVGFTLVLVLTFLSPVIARGADVTVAVFASPLGQVMKKALIEPFRMESKLDIAIDNRPFGVGVVRAKILGGGNVWDVVTLENVEALQGCTEGYFAKIDKARLPNLAHFDLMDDRFECGVPSSITAPFWGTTKSKLRRNQNRGRTFGIRRHGLASAP